ncbi:septal ring lytic transglycosylase RlpA family protein [Flavobacterium sp.]|jgi:rare lipoprotein A|uniref:septal ring lytic transglycosylase RlpA family protein n=1 Tax=Flavobacterium sp. TaxID=239 RepID=UPI0037C01E3A
MNNKIVILILTLTTSLFGSVLVDNKPQQKDKNKEKSAKVSQSKEHDKSAAVTKVDTAKSKLKNGLEIDTLNLSDLKVKLLKKNAHASYYHNKFNGRRTASGKRFDNNGYTAAHKKLPFGTMVRVTNEANGKSVLVEITDRGPFSKAREIDLSKRAFMDIASNKNSGMVIVTLDVIEPKK